MAVAQFYFEIAIPLFLSTLKEKNAFFLKKLVRLRGFKLHGCDQGFYRIDPRKNKDNSGFSLIYRQSPIFY